MMVHREDRYSLMVVDVQIVLVVIHKFIFVVAFNDSQQPHRGIISVLASRSFDSPQLSD